MYAFLIVVTIILPTLKPTKEIGPPVATVFRITDDQQYSQYMCIKASERMADRVIEYAKRRAPYAGIRSEATCSPIETRRI